MTVCASSSNVTHRGARAGLAARDPVGSRTAPRTPVTAPSVRRARRRGAGSGTRPGRRRRRPARGARTARPCRGRCPRRCGSGAPSCRAGGPVAAALGPADDREEADALLVEPGPLLPGRELQVGLGPLPRPVVLGAVEAGGAEPVLPGQLERVVHPQPALLRGVDEEEAAEGPERLPAEGRLGLLVEQDHPLAGVGQLGGGDQSGQAGAHDDDIGLLDGAHGPTLAGATPRRPSGSDAPARRTTRAPGAAAPAPASPAGPPAAGDRPQLGAATESAEQEDQDEQRPSGRTAATARTASPRAGPGAPGPTRGRPRGQQQRDDEEPVDRRIGLPEQPAQVQHPAIGGNRRRRRTGRPGDAHGARSRHSMPPGRGPRRTPHRGPGSRRGRRHGRQPRTPT